MDKIDIIISTRNRFDKLMRLLDSIPPHEFGIKIRVRIACDGDHGTFSKITDKKYAKVDKVLYFPMQRGAVYCRNELLKECEDAVVPAPDDIEFQKGSIWEAVNMFIENFASDNDGVVGFNQIGNNKFCKSGVSLIGRKFLSRYPDKQLFNPGYFHFAAQEILWAAVELGKFMFCKKAIVKHYNPFVDPSQMDQTHKDARIFKEQDHRLSLDRQKEGKIWGING